MSEEKLSLSWPPWHTHADHLKEMLRNMKTDDTFTDVTLVCDDGRKIRAHKVVLGASSPVMKKMLTNADTSIIDLEGMAFEEINSILQFIYLGEATLFQERMQEFLDAAQKLKVKELYREPKMEFDMNNALSNEYDMKNYDDSKMLVPKYACNFCNEIFTNRSELTPHITSMHGGIKYACNQCGHQATRQKNLTRHIQRVHEGVKFACNHCDQQFTQQGHLTTHIQSVHKGVKHACYQCDYQGTKDSLRKHIQYKHEEKGIKYTCNLCYKQYTRSSLLTAHILSVHAGVKYTCKQCDLQFGYRRYLTQHTKTVHEGVQYSCNQCDFQFGYRSHLNEHIKSVHEGV